MSFTKLTKKELVRTAEEDFGVDVDKSRDKPGIMAQLEEHGVTWEMYLEENPDKRELYEPKVPDNVIRVAHEQDPVYDVAYPDAKPVMPPAPEENLVLVKMTRVNPLYEVGPYRFTQEHPYVLVKEDDADYILMEEDGFRQATPRELRQYYS